MAGRSEDRLKRMVASRRAVMYNARARILEEHTRTRMTGRILFVGRYPDHFAPLWRHLGSQDMDVAFAASQKSAMRELEREPADVIILDASSLRSAGAQLCRAMRQSAPAARIVLISDGPGPTSICYDLQLIKPVAMEELSLAVGEALQSERRQVLSAGLFMLDLKEQTVIGPAGERRLTPKLYELLRLLLSHPDEVVRRQTIMQLVWHTDYLEDTRTLDVHVSWLRGVLEPDPKHPRYLITKRGAGYILYPDGKL